MCCRGFQKSAVLVFLALSVVIADPIPQSWDESFDYPSLDYAPEESDTVIWDQKFSSEESNCGSHAQDSVDFAPSLVAHADIFPAEIEKRSDLAPRAEFVLPILVPPRCPEGWVALCCLGKLLWGEIDFCAPCKGPTPHRTALASSTEGWKTANCPG